MGLESVKGAVLVEKSYEDLELWYPLLRLREAGASMQIVGPVAGETYESKHGYPAKSDIAALDLEMPETDVLIIPGGYAPDRMRRDRAMVNLVASAFSGETIVGFICHAGWMPVSANILHGKRATSVSAIKDDMINAGAEWVDEEVVQDGNLISSRTPQDLPAFCKTIIQNLEQ